MSSSLDLDEVLSTIVTRAVELSGTEGGSIFEFDEAGQEFLVRTAHGTSKALLEALHAATIGLHNTLVGRAALARTPLAVADSPRPPAIRTRPAAYGGRAALDACRPARARESDTRRTRRSPAHAGEFSTRVTELLETFASQSALAIQNACLFRELGLKNRELEILSRHKSEFLAHMSHELRTPLNAVIGFSEVLLERLFGELNPKQEDYLQDILASGRHLLSLINDVLDVSKVEAGRMELEVGSMSLETVIEGALMLVREQASRAGLSLTLDVEPDFSRRTR